MKLKRRGPLNLTGGEPPTAEPDNDLDMPPFATGPAGGALARADASAPARHDDEGARFAAAPVPAHRPAPQPDPARYAYLIAALVSVLWAGLAVYYVMTQTTATGQLDRAVLVVLTVVPVGFVWLFAYALRQGAAIAAEMRRARATSEMLLGPAAQAAAEAGSLVEAVRQEIDAAATAAANARTELSALREILNEETSRLLAAAGEAGRTGAALGETLGREREHLSAVSARLDGQAVAVADAVTRQARMVTEASDLAQAQITESEAALAARAADLAAAAGEASDAARIASEDLSRQALRLETATIGVADQTRSLEQTLTDQRASLVAVAHELRGDNEDFAIRLETQRAQLAEMLTKARHSVTEINEAASSGAEALRELADLAAGQAQEVHTATAARIAELAETAAARAQELADTAQTERDLLSAGALQSVGAVTQAARFEREALEADTRKAMQAFEADSRKALDAFEADSRRSLEQLEVDTRKALDLLAEAAAEAQRHAGEHVEAARLNVVGLSEAAFDAGQKAEAAYQARLDEAQGLISRSADLVDQAAGASAEKLERAAENARAVLTSLESAVAEVEARVAHLPEQASAQAEAMKLQLAESFDGLLSSARAAAEETQAIDQAFQERVRRNYEMLSEAVRLMGVMSNPAQRAIPRPAPSAPAPQPAAEPPAPAAEAEPIVKPVETTRPRRGFFERAAHRPSSAEPQERAPEPDAKPAAPQPAARAPEPEPPVRAAEPEAPASETPAPETPGLRPRLKLAPTDSDAHVSQVFEQAQGQGPAKPAAEAEGGWTWQELLTSMDDGPVDDAKLADRLIGEIEALGVDLAAILPEARVHEIATVLETGDYEGARLVVRHLAPAAVRRLSRKALTEPGLRAHAERFVGRWRETVAETARRDPSGDAVAGKLASESGRAFLIFDAAVGELA